MSKIEARNAIRLLFYKWRVQYAAKGALPDVKSFFDWLATSGYGHYLEFPCDTSPAQEIRAWFSEELART